VAKDGSTYYFHLAANPPATLPDGSPVGSVAGGDRPAIARGDDATVNAVHHSFLGELRLPRSQGGLGLSNQHWMSLKRRGLSDAQIGAGMYRTRPQHDCAQEIRRLIKEFGREAVYSVPGFYPGDGHRPKLACGPGLLVPVRDRGGRIVGLKCRPDEPLPDGRKYYHLSSAKHGGPGPGNRAHVPLGIEGPVERVRITEGELKGDVATDLSGVPTISSPGVTSWRAALDEAIALGARTVSVAMDADWRTNPNVARGVALLCKAVTDAGLALEIETWDPAAGKGIDDVLQRCGAGAITVARGEGVAAVLDEVRAAAKFPDDRARRGEGDRGADGPTAAEADAGTQHPTVEAGQWVRCRDRTGEDENIGEVIEDLGESCLIQFKGKYNREIHKRYLRNMDGSPLGEGDRPAEPPVVEAAVLAKVKALVADGDPEALVMDDALFGQLARIAGTGAYEAARLAVRSSGKPGFSVGAFDARVKAAAEKIEAERRSSRKAARRAKRVANRVGQAAAQGAGQEGLEGVGATGRGGVQEDGDDRDYSEEEREHYLEKAKAEKAAVKFKFFGNFTEEEVELPDGSEDDEEDAKTITVPRSIAEMDDDLELVAPGLFNRVGTQLFIRNADHTTSYIDSPSSLLSAIARHAMPQWHKDGSYITKNEYFESKRRSAPNYEAIERLPHEPSMVGIYYAHPHLPDPAGKLDGLMGFFKPATPEDRDLIKALVVTGIWGGAPGKRPSFMITGPDDDPQQGRGIGKSTLLDTIADEILGGSIDVSPSDEIAAVKTRLLSDEARQIRMARLDNVKSLKFSWADLEGLITAPVISGRMLYKGEGRRPNTLIWCITLNGGNLSKDMAQRVIVIKLDRPEFKPDWETGVRDYARRHRWEIIAEAMQILRKEATKIEAATRWADWERSVLSRVAGDLKACQKVILDRQGEVDSDDSERDTVRDYFAGRLKYHYDVEPDTLHVLIPSKDAARWLSGAERKNYPTNHASARLGNLGVPELRKSRKTDLRGWVWRGERSCAQPDDDPRLLVLKGLDFDLS
jgi:hypothetical protein